MVNTKSLDELSLIAALLRDAQTLHSEVYSPRALRLDIEKMQERFAHEGMGFLTKTLPRLGKAFDRALSGEIQLDSRKLAFKSQPSSQLPMFMGGLFRCIFSSDGWVLSHPAPDVKCIKTIRQISYLFYKYELPYDRSDEDKVLSSFKDTESLLRRDVCPGLEALSSHLDKWSALDIHSRTETSFGEYQGPQIPCDGHVECVRESESRHDIPSFGSGRPSSGQPEDLAGAVCASLRCRNSGHSARCRYVRDLPNDRNATSGSSYTRYCGRATVVLRARKLLIRLFSHFDPLDIHPRHGPGAVSTRKQLWEKYQWDRVSSRIRDTYALDAYFYASLSHVCDRLQEMQNLGDADAFARVCLVPKDSRGPRLISCEPDDFMWVQQGLGRAIVEHVERHPLTRWNVHFTDQSPNQFGALLGSSTGRYATLDLKEASDRVTVELVRLLFPEPLLGALMNCRTVGTELPSGEILQLQKFAPMGSSLCFPILALTVWSLLAAGCSDADTREGILVYGDDVIVPTAYAEAAITTLESFGLLCNRDKSFVRGLFRESCGVDAFNGVNVTPVKLRTVWTSRPSPESYVSFMAYANEFWHRKYYHAYDYIVEHLGRLYGQLPTDEQALAACPSLPEVPEAYRLRRKRFNSALQRVEWKMRTIRSPKVTKEIDGWSMLLRYFAEAGNQSSPSLGVETSQKRWWDTWLTSESDSVSFSVRSYTKRRASMLAWCWR